MSTIGFHHLIQRLGKAGKMPFPLHPHMLRHACGYKLANDGHDTRALQHYLGHKNIQHTVRYTQLSPIGSSTSGEIELPSTRGSAHLNELGCACGRRHPRVGGTLDFDNCSCPLSQKPLQKRFLPRRG